MKVYEAVAETLGRLGVDAAFGLVGSGNFGLIDHMTRQCGVAYHASRHEAAAVAMADGYARVSGNLGVCTVHQGPGVTNTLTALTEAVKARTPLLLLAGDTATTALYQNLDVDQDAVVGSVGAGVERIRDADTAIADIARAARRAALERRPIVVSLPIDVQAQECEAEDPPAFAENLASAPRPSEEAVSEVAGLLDSSSRPVIVAGRGAVLARARPQLEALGGRIGALFATSMMAKGFFSGNTFDLGVSGGFSSPLAAHLLGEADLVLSFGASLNTWTTNHRRMFSPSSRIVHCDLEASAIGRIQPVTLGVIGDAASTAEALLEELDGRGASYEGFRTGAVAREIEEFRWEDEFEDAGTEDTVDPRSVLMALDAILPEQRTVAVDCGHFAGFAAMHLRVPDAAGFVFAEAFQAVGLGMGAGMGAAVARPDRLTVVVVGDGGLLMSLGELDAAVQLGAPLLVVVMNDAGYGAEVHHFRALGLPTDLALLGERDFAEISAAMGGQGSVVRNVSDLQQVKEWIEAPEGVMVLDCKVNPRVEGEYLKEAFIAEA
ncbi:MAG TPA: thiamine pyrophosphate-binding protein [Rubrobacteraceae bacterium]|nr:thiamine pyrophosphate-binding protein [Rubrobacteraceae bacterium]